MKKLILVITILLWISVALKSQEKKEFSLLDDLKAQEKYYNELFLLKNGQMEGIGYKQFLRRKAFLEPRLDKNGTLEEYVNAKIAYNKIRSGVHEKSGIQTAPANWIFLGPKGFPATPDSLASHSSNGKGMIRSIWVDPSNHDRIYAGANRGGLWYTGDGGDTWVLLTGGYYNLTGITDIIVNGTNIWVICDMSDYYWGVARSQDGGQTWQFLHNITDENQDDLYPSSKKTSRPMRIAIDPDNPQILFLVTYNKIYRTSNGGNSWNLVHYESDWDFWADGEEVSGFWDIEVLDNIGTTNVVYVSGREIIRSMDGGLTWNEYLTEDVLDVLGKDPVNDPVRRCEMSIDNINHRGKVWLMVRFDENNGTLYVVKDNHGLLPASGKAVEPEMDGEKDEGPPDYEYIANSEKSNNSWLLSNIAVSPTDEDVFYLYLQTIKKYDGVTPYDDINCNANFTSPSYNYVDCGGDYGPEYSYWIHADIRDMQVLVENGHDVIFTGDDGGVTRSTTAPASGFWEWEKISDDGSCGLYVTEFYAIDGAERDPGLIAGGCQDVSSFVYDNGTWYHTGSSDGGESLIDHNNPYYAYLMHFNTLYRHIDKGKYLGTSITSGSRYQGFGLKMDPNNSNTLYFGDETLKKITNASGSHTVYLINSLNNIMDGKNITTMEIPAQNSDILHVFTNYIKYGNPPYSKGYFRSTDGGSSWSDLSNTCGLPFGWNTVDAVISNPLDEDELWVGLGKVDLNKPVMVYHSTNGGNSFSEMGSSGYPTGIPVNDLEYDHINKKLYVATDVGVFFWDKHSSSWKQYANCLPYGCIQDVELNLTIKKIRVIEYGYGLWEASLQFCPPDAIRNLSGTVSQAQHIEAYQYITSSQNIINDTKTTMIAPLVTLNDGFYATNLEIQNYESTCNAQCQSGCQ